jgi:GNAT superfamily N-acetyltransferase
MTATIRIAGQADVGTVADLLRERDGAAHPTAAVAAYLADLDPARITVWLAEKEGRPIGMNAVYRRTIASPVGPLAASYWAHLYVRPEARSLMIYPQLVMAMLRWAQAGNADLVYTATRQEHVAAAHLKLGFARLVTIPVLIRPLRPGRLVASRSPAARRWAGWAVPLIDGALSACRVTAAMIPGRTAATRAVRSDNRAADDLAGLAVLPSGDAARIRTAYTATDWLVRFSGTIEGQGYRAAVAPREGKPEAGVLVRIAERGSPPVRIGVVLELVDQSAGQAYASALLRWVEQAAVEAGADAIIALSPTADVERRAYQARGYWNAPETYTLVYRPTSTRGQADSLRDPMAWRFSFAEHDSF